MLGLLTRLKSAFSNSERQERLEAELKQALKMVQEIEMTHNKFYVEAKSEIMELRLEVSKLKRENERLLQNQRLGKNN